MLEDLVDARAIRLKALLFGACGLMASVLLLAGSPSWTTAFLVVVQAWAWCRLYYFLFHVGQHWLGGGRWRGLFHLLRACSKRAR